MGAETSRAGDLQYRLCLYTDIEVPPDKNIKEAVHQILKYSCKALTYKLSMGENCHKRASHRGVIPRGCYNRSEVYVTSVRG